MAGGEGSRGDANDAVKKARGTLSSLLSLYNHDGTLEEGVPSLSSASRSIGIGFDIAPRPTTAQPEELQGYL